ncbi:MAG: aminoacyl-tRNA hydrolase [Chlamydiae bacterium]|nr:aminoacyl-tRNA hydrolase [Chlamydiota bacterium]
MKLIVGLGNPGIAYKYTRHNMGFLIADAFCKKNNFFFTKKAKFKASEASGNNTLVIKPETYMNLSGGPVQSVMYFYKLSLDKLLIISDDVALPFGELRLRAAGSAGGHNGLKSIEYSLQSQSWARLRIGVGTPKAGQPLEDYVLESFSITERESLSQLIDKAVDAIESWCALSVSKAMTIVNKPSKE